MEFFKKTPSIPFMEKRKWAYVLSAILIVGSIISLATRGLNLGIDFTGGVVVEVGYPGSVDLDRAREAVEAAGFESPAVQTVDSSREIMVRVMPNEGEDVNQVAEHILAALRTVDPGAQLRKKDVISAQVGEELAEQGGLAMLFTFIMILIYVAFRFEKKMASGTVLAAMHEAIDSAGAGSGGWRSSAASACS